MTNELLTIGVTFCDKDQHLIPSLIDNIKQCVKVPYNLIIMDNRKIKSNLDFDITMSFDNQGCFIPRKAALPFITGKYVWWIDADDTLPNDITADLFDIDADIITFKVRDSNGNLTGTWPNRDESVYSAGIINLEFNIDGQHLIGPCMWNKFIKSEIFKYIADIPDFKGICNEDNFITTYMMKFIKTVICKDIQLYQYNLTISDLRSENVTMEIFERLCIGSSKIYELAKTLFTEQELIDCDDWFCPDQSCRALFHLIARSPQNLIEDEFKLLHNEYSYEVMQRVIRKFLVY